MICGRVVHQMGYASGGYGKHAPGALAIQKGHWFPGKEKDMMLSESDAGVVF